MIHDVVPILSADATPFAAKVLVPVDAVPASVMVSEVMAIEEEVELLTKTRTVPIG
jgi:hypothetical protein